MSAVETAPQNTTEPPEALAEATREQIFRYSRYIHVGEGAHLCALAQWLESPKDGRSEKMPQCEDPEGHFHAWVRLPNAFQMKDIAEKARAARARRVRSLKDPESDAYVILENELDALRDESMRVLMVEELLDKDFTADYDTALREVLEIEDPDYVPEDEGDEIPKLYANIEQDQEEYARQVKLPEEQRTEDFDELHRTVQRFSEAIQAELEKIIKPKRKTLTEDRTLDELIDMVRQERINQSGNEAYLHTFNSWQWFVCTYKPRKGTPDERAFQDFTQFRLNTPPEVIHELQSAFTALELEMAGNRRGNS